MISNETLTHKNPITGEPAMISLGWMDDSMTMNGPTEEDPNYISDTGFSTQQMQDQVDAYRTTITQFNEAVYAAGGFTWMMMDWGGARLNTGINNTTDTATCKTILASSCVPSPSRWNRFQGYAIPGGGFNMNPQSFTDYTAGELAPPTFPSNKKKTNSKYHPLFFPYSPHPFFFIRILANSRTVRNSWLYMERLH